MTLIERTFVNQLKLRRTKTEGDRPPDWRRVERVLIDFLESCGIRIIDVAAEPFIDVVRYYEGDEAVVSRVSIEQLAKLLVKEIW